MSLEKVPSHARLGCSFLRYTGKTFLLSEPRSRRRTSLRTIFESGSIPSCLNVDLVSDLMRQNGGMKGWLSFLFRIICGGCEPGRAYSWRKASMGLRAAAWWAGK